MKKTELTKEFQIQITKLFQDYKFRKIIDGYFLEKEFHNRGNRIVYGFSHYGENHIISSFSCSIRFNIVEEILTPIFIKHQIVPKNHDFNNTKTVIWSLRNEKEAFKKIRTTKINNKKDLKEILSVVKKYLDEKILPFFGKYQDLKEVAVALEQMEQKDQVNFLGGFDFLLRRIIIVYLIQDKRLYGQYKKEAKEIYEERKNKSERHLKYLLAFNELIEILENNTQCV